MIKRVCSLLCTLTLTAALLPLPTLSYSVSTSGDSTPPSPTEATEALPQPQFPDLRFPDVSEGSWYYDTVMDCAQYGVVSGYPDGSFHPDQPISVLEFFLLADRALPAYPQGFAYDTSYILAQLPGYWGAPHVARAIADRDLTNFPVTREFWDAPADRQTMAFILDRLSCRSPNWKPKPSYIEASAAIGDYSSWIFTAEFPWAILHVYSEGLITGVNEQGDFRPFSNATRAQACAIIYRIRHPETCKPLDREQVTALYQARQQDLLANPVLTDGSPITAENVQRLMLALKVQFPEGMPWGDDISYQSIPLGRDGQACAAFAFRLSDLLFGELPISSYYDDPALIRPGDDLRVHGDSHAVVVLEVHPDHIVVAEGNVNSAVHWGRHISMSELSSDPQFHGRSRWPAGI